MRNLFPEITMGMDFMESIAFARWLAAAPHGGPGRKSYCSGMNDWRRYAGRSRYSPKDVRRLGAERGVGGPRWIRA